MRSTNIPLIAAAAATLAAGCASGDADESGENMVGGVQVVTLAEGLANPWSLAFLPDGGILVTERSGQLRVVRDGRLDPEPVSGVPESVYAGQGGLLEVSLHPDYAENGQLYLTYAKAGEQGATTALARATFDGTGLHDVEDIFVADAWATTNLHYGSRLAWAPDGTLFMTVGERNMRNRAQDPGDHAGSIVRLNDDGSVPDDNPFIGQDGFRPEIYSYGHRNPQGLMIHPDTGELWTNEHGPQGGDEVNVVTAGGNYGWPVITFGREYSGAVITDQPWQAGMQQPLAYWVPSIGVSGMTAYTGDAFPEWRGSVFVGGLAGRSAGVHRIGFDVDGPDERESILSELGARIRDVRQGPDGYLYVVTDANTAREAASGTLLRLEPAG